MGVGVGQRLADPGGDPADRLGEVAGGQQFPVAQGRQIQQFGPTTGRIDRVEDRLTAPGSAIVGRQHSADLLQGRPVDVLHAQQPQTPRPIDGLRKDAHDVVVFEAGHRAGLAAPVGGDFQRDVAVEGHLAGQVHGGKAALPQNAQQFKVADLLARAGPAVHVHRSVSGCQTGQMQLRRRLRRSGDVDAGGRIRAQSGRIHDEPRLRGESDDRRIFRALIGHERNPRPPRQSVVATERRCV